MFFDWKIQLEKIQLTRDLSDNTMIYQGIRLPCKNDQGYCDPTTRTQATIVWFPEDTWNLIQNTPYEFAVGTEELKTIKALQLLWPLLQTKNIIRILAKLLTNSDIIHDIFPHGFFPDD